MKDDKKILAKVFFENDEMSYQKSHYLAENYQIALNWEKESVSNHSPGQIAADELIARQVHSPIHIDNETNELTPAAYNDVFDKGLSTNRMSYLKNGTIHDLEEAKAEADRCKGKNDRRYIGYVAAEVRDIRSITDLGTNERLFGVYDTGVKDSPHHADICMIRPGVIHGNDLPKKPLKKARRKLLKDAFGSLVRKEQDE